ncbi:MAG: xylose isomerase [Geminicoccaceae bacterium]
MTEGYFDAIPPIRFEGPDSDNPLAFRFYDKDRLVLGKRLEDHLRFAVCYWHSFCGTGVDIFGAGTYERPWFEPGDPMARAKEKMDAAFAFMERLGAPFWCFHDYDIAPEAATIGESRRRFDTMVDLAQKKMEETGVKLLWGTANLFSHPRYAAGSATNPDPEIVAYAASQVQQCLDATKRLGGVNYVLWGGREGYESLLNTDLKREAEQAGRFLAMVVEHKRKIGFDGTILVEPKPQEPPKHQYDFDVATIYGFLKRFGLENEVKINVEVNHATLANHSFHHEIALAASLGILGSVDANRGDPQSGWDTGQFPNSVEELTLAAYEILRHGGFDTGGFNFDAKLRRQSIDPEDLFYAHIGGMDVMALAWIKAAALVESRVLSDAVAARYRGWDEPLGREIMDGTHDLASLSLYAQDRALDPKPVSGRQELLENHVNRVIYDRGD